MEQVTTFLKGLNENFTNVKSQIMLMSPLPAIGKVCSLIQQQERQFVRVIHEDSTQTAFLTRSSQAANTNFSQHKSSGRPICSFCGLAGHTVDKCYKKHRYPPGWKGKNKQNVTYFSGNKAVALVANLQLNPPLDEQKGSINGEVLQGDTKRANAFFYYF